MILLKISNASELVASKVGEFVERLTPDSLDHSAVEDLVLKEIIASLRKEGLKGQVSTVRGLEVENDRLVFNGRFKIRENINF